MRWLAIVLFAGLASCGEDAAPPRQRQPQAEEERVVIPQSSLGPCASDSDCRMFRDVDRCGCGAYALLASAPDPVCRPFRGEEGCIGFRPRHAVCEAASHRCALADGPAPSAEGPARPRRLDAEAAARLRAALREGRRASREERHPEALARMEEALALDPANRRLRCETGYVAFRGGQAQRARELIRQALAGMDPGPSAPQPMRNHYAMCLYNAGLVYASDGRAGDARDAWERSLALRPNDTVAQRLARLTDAPSPPRRLALDPTAPFERLARAVADHVCPDLMTDVDASCAELQLDVVHTLPPGEGIEAQVVKIASGFWTELYVLLVRGGGRVAAFSLEQIDNPGVAGVSADGGVSGLSRVDALPGGQSELRVDSSRSWVDHDMAGCLGMGESRARTVLCTIDGGLRCAEIVTAESDTSWCDLECIDVAEDEDPSAMCEGMEIAPMETPRTRSYELALTITPGEATLALARAEDREPPVRAVGTHPLSTIFSSQALPPIE
jgi:hypothetical protein